MPVTDPLKDEYSGSPTALALGTFDGVHLGHRAVLAHAVNVPGLVPGVFTFTENPAAVLGFYAPRITDFETKCRLLQQAGIRQIFAADFARLQTMPAEDFVRQVLLKRCKAGKIICGYNFRFGSGGRADAEMLQKLCADCGVACTVVQQVRDGENEVCSTRIRGLIEQGDVKAAAALLGRAFSFTLPVVRGKQLGRTIGIPTINQPLPAQLVCPRHGVYASFVTLQGRRYAAVTDIGVKPTVAQGAPVQAETCIFGFSGDLYGQQICVSLLDFLRPEQRFEGLAQLQKQIETDAAKAKKIALQNDIAML